jgi:hypothetical protein
MAQSDHWEDVFKRPVVRCRSCGTKQAMRPDAALPTCAFCGEHLPTMPEKQVLVRCRTCDTRQSIPSGSSARCVYCGEPVGDSEGWDANVGYGAAGVVLATLAWLGLLVHGAAWGFLLGPLAFAPGCVALVKTSQGRHGGLGLLLGAMAIVMVVVGSGVGMNQDPLGLNNFDPFGSGTTKPAVYEPYGTTQRDSSVAKVTVYGVEMPIQPDPSVNPAPVGGGAFAAADVEVCATGAGGRPGVGPGNFDLVEYPVAVESPTSQAVRKVAAHTVRSMKEPAFPDMTYDVLPVGTCVRGWVSFEVDARITEDQLAVRYQLDLFWHG